MFLKELPRCPSCPELDYQYTRYCDYRGFREFIISCPGRHRGLEEGYPKTTDRSSIASETDVDFSAQFSNGEKPYSNPGDVNFAPTFEPQKSAEQMYNEVRELGELRKNKASGSRQ
jgi:hypothetical protein